ncbi:MAG TPA: carboxypeptidase-like regulatory domain-containing protein [Solirubrobacterales bacterium]
MLALAWGAAPAQAGQYTVWSCRGPEGTPIPTGAWREQSEDAAAGDMTVTDDCAAGGSLRIEATPGGTNSDRQPAVEAIFEPPAGTFIPSFKIWRYAAANDGPDTPADESDYAASLREWPWELGGEGYVNECALGHPRSCSFGSLEHPLADSNLVTEHTWTAEVPGEGIWPLEKIGFWVSCLRLGCEPPAAGHGPAAVFELFRSAITIEDDQAPTVERLEGSLTETAPLSGTAHLLVTAGDVGGGIAGFDFSVDGGPSRRVSLANGKGGCEEPFAQSRPCPSEATRVLAVDTGALAAGAHTVSGAVVDAAGNSTPFGPLAFTVAAPRVEPPPPVGTGQVAVAAASAEGGPNNGTPAVEAPRLQLRGVSSTHADGKPGRLGGTLTTPSGEPIKGASLGVEITELGGGHRPRKRQVRTDGNGRFEFAVGGAGARTVVVSYAPTLGGPVSRSADTLLKTPLALSLTPRPRAVRNGRTAHFRGRLKGAGGAAQGANVEIQAIAGGRWTTIDTVAVGRNGSFSWAHRFRYVERDALFSFRAVVPRTPGWPWQTVRSRRIELPIEGAPR